MAESYLGSCLCASVRYEVRAQPKAVTHCHCSQCQKGHGAVARSDLHIVSGALGIKSYASSEFVLRQFCAHCSSSLFCSRTRGDWSD